MQHFESFRVSFDDGVAEGDRMLALLAKIGQGHAARYSEFSSPNELQPIFDYLVDRSKRYAYLYVEGFLSRVIKPTEFDTGIICFWGADEFIENQSHYAPVCEFDDELQIVQFGYISGDGDAWCLDLKFQEIICLSPGADGATEDSARRNKYGVFPAFDYLTSFLQTDAQRRGWLPR